MNDHESPSQDSSWYWDLLEGWSSSLGMLIIGLGMLVVWPLAFRKWATLLIGLVLVPLSLLGMLAMPFVVIYRKANE